MRRIASSLIMAVLFLSLFALAFTLQTARAQSGTIYIMPDGSISSPAGISANITTFDNVTYTFTRDNYLPIVVNRSNIIINGMGYTLQAPEGYGFSLLGMNNVTIENTTITNSALGFFLNNSYDNILSGNIVANSDYGMFLGYSSGNVLSGNTITGNEYGGMWLAGSSGNFLSGNIIKDDGGGIFLEFSSQNFLINNNLTANEFGVLLGGSSGNILSGNDVAGNSNCSIWLYSSSGNRIFHNDFSSNTQQTNVFNSTNTWDDGYPSGGNYWSDYRTTYPNATEIDSSAIWNTPYVIDANNTDRYPLMGPFHTFGVGTWNGTAYSVDTVSNSSITNLSFNATAKTLTFNVTGTSGTAGFCRVAIPKTLMSCVSLEDWVVTVNGTLINDRAIINSTSCTYIYFAYHHSTETVQITSTSAIPEFQPFMLLPLLMIITLLTAIVSKRKRKAAHVTKLAKG